MNNGFQFADIIFLAAIVAFLVFRLRGALGRRDGHEGGYADPFRRPKTDAKEAKPEGEVVPLPGRDRPFDLGGDTRAADKPVPHRPQRPSDRIRAADPSFSEETFLGGARVAFEMVLNAFAKSEERTLRQLLTGDVFDKFASAIRDRETAGLTLEQTLVKIKDAALQGRKEVVTVRFVSDQISVVRDSSGSVVEGDPERVVEVTDSWTFVRDVRSRDPNWQISATEAPD